MIYQTTISTPIATYVTTPKRTALKVTKGLVYKVEIAFPPGPASLLKVQIFDGGHQQWPSTPGEYFQTDAYVISFDDTFLKLTEPYQFDIYTWNLDDTYAHSITVRIGMVSKELYMARFLPSIAYEQMLKILAEEQARQEAEREVTIKEPFSWLKESE